LVYNYYDFANIRDADCETIKWEYSDRCFGEDCESAPLNIIAVILIEVILLFIAMMCRSLVHTLLHHYGKFTEKYNIRNHRFWNPEISWVDKYELNEDGSIKLDGNDKPIKKKGVWIFWYDAFHRFNTVELGTYDLAITIPLTITLGLVWWWGIVIFLIIGVALMPLFFNLGYDEIWK
jgi:hypothetical protein